MEVIELQCKSVLKAKDENVEITTFYEYIGPTWKEWHRGPRQCLLVLLRSETPDRHVSKASQRGSKQQ